MEEIVYRKAASKLQLTNMIIEGGHFTLGAQKTTADADLQVRHTVLHFGFGFFFLTYLFIRPCWVLFAACGIFSYSVWDLVP